MNKNRGFFHWPALLSLILVISFVLAGCSGSQVAGVSKIEPTASTVPSNTPAPTSTFTPVPTSTLTATPTLVPTATPNKAATRAASQKATQAAEDAANEKRVNADLTRYGIDPTLGKLVWVMDTPLELDGGGYATGWYQPIPDLDVLKDFVMQTKITWDTSGGLAGCAYIFRAPEDWDLETSSYYSLNIVRLQYNPVWVIDYFEDGFYQYSAPSGNGVPAASINDEKMSQNVLTLDARGGIFTIYINGVKQQIVENNKVTEGRLALEVIQNSGTSYCRFENGWVWEYNQ